MGQSTIFNWDSKKREEWVEISTHFLTNGEVVASSGDVIATAVASGTAALVTTYPHCLAIGSSTSTDNKGSSVQWTPKCIGFNAGKTVDGRVKLFYTTATNGEGCFGLSVVDTTVTVTNGPPVAGVAAEVTDFVGIVKTSQSAVLKFNIVRDSTLNFSMNICTMTDLAAADIEWGIEMHPTEANAGYLTVYVNKTPICIRTKVTGVPIGSEELLVLTAENITSAAGATYAYVDCIGVRQQL